MMSALTAQDLLQRMLKCLPKGWWWMLNQKETDDNGLARAFDQPCSEIEALLLVAGVCKITTRGVAFDKKRWEHFYSQHFTSHPLLYQTSGNTVYVVNGEPLKYTTPTKQTRARPRCITRATLPRRMIDELAEVVHHYNSQNDMAAVEEAENVGANEEDGNKSIPSLEHGNGGDVINEETGELLNRVIDLNLAVDYAENAAIPIPAQSISEQYNVIPLQFSINGIWGRD